MYAWVWQHLPGPTWIRALFALLLLSAAVVLLFAVVFPWAQAAIPFLQVTVDESLPQGSATAYAWGWVLGSAHG